MRKKLNKLPLITLVRICERWNSKHPTSKEEAINLIVGWCEDYSLTYSDLQSAYDLPDA